MEDLKNKTYTELLILHRNKSWEERTANAIGDDSDILYAELTAIHCELQLRERAIGVHHRPVGNHTPDSSIPPLHCFKEYQMALVGLEEMNMMAQSSVYEEPYWIVKEKIELQYRIEMFKQKHSIK